MKLASIAGFSALKFKETTQERIQSELSELPENERLTKIRRDIESGPLADWWHRLRLEQIERTRLEMDRKQHESAA